MDHNGEIIAKTQKLWSMLFSDNPHEALVARDKLRSLLKSDGLHPADMVVTKREGSLAGHVLYFMQKADDFLKKSETYKHEARDARAANAELQRFVQELQDKLAAAQAAEHQQRRDYVTWVTFKELGQKLVGAERGWQARLSEMLCVTPSTISNYKCGRTLVPRWAYDALRKELRQKRQKQQKLQERRSVRLRGVRAGASHGHHAYA